MKTMISGYYVATAGNSLYIMTVYQNGSAEIRRNTGDGSKLIIAVNSADKLVPRQAQAWFEELCVVLERGYTNDKSTSAKG